MLMFINKPIGTSQSSKSGEEKGFSNKNKKTIIMYSYLKERDSGIYTQCDKIMKYSVSRSKP